jgi:hypothetical protein
MARPTLATLGLAGLLLSQLGTGSSRAQEPPPLASDRPDFTETASSVPRGSVQVEVGATWTDDGGEALSVGEVLVRIGLGRGLELRLGPGGYGRIEAGEATVEGREDGFVGLKLELGARPALALLLGSSIPTGSADLGADAWQPEAVLALAWTLSPRLSLASNLGAGSFVEADERFETAFGSLALGFAASERLGLFVELYALGRETPGGDLAPTFDTGATWLLSPDLQLDARVEIPLGRGEPEPSLGVGLVARW